MSLDDLIESRGNAGGAFPIPVPIDIIAQIARGMCFLHDLKMGSFLNFLLPILKITSV